MRTRQRMVLCRAWCCTIVMVTVSGFICAGESLRPPPSFGQDGASYREVSSLPGQESGPSGIALPLPPPDKALAKDNAPPPVPFGKAREVLAPTSPSLPGSSFTPMPSYGYGPMDADPYGMYDPYMDEYGMMPEDEYAQWTPPIPTARPPQGPSMPVAAPPSVRSSPSPMVRETMLIDPFPRTLAEMSQHDYEALMRYPEYLEYNEMPFHEKVRAYTKLFEDTRGRRPNFESSVLAEARASAPPPQTIREANQDLYRSPAGQREPGKMDSLRGALRKDLFQSGR